jgi:hypothetical protein
MFCKKPACSPWQKDTKTDIVEPSPDGKTPGKEGDFV